MDEETHKEIIGPNFRINTLIMTELGLSPPKMGEENFWKKRGKCLLDLIFIYHFCDNFERAVEVALGGDRYSVANGHVLFSGIVESAEKRSNDRESVFKFYRGAKLIQQVPYSYEDYLKLLDKIDQEKMCDKVTNFWRGFNYDKNNRIMDKLGINYSENRFKGLLELAYIKFFDNDLEKAEEIAMGGDIHTVKDMPGFVAIVEWVKEFSYDAHRIWRHYKNGFALAHVEYSFDDFNELRRRFEKA